MRRLAILGLLLPLACGAGPTCSTPPRSYEGTHTIARREAADPGHWDRCADTGDCLALCQESGAGVVTECRRLDDRPRDAGRDDGGADARDDATVTIHVVQQTGGCGGG